MRALWRLAIWGTAAAVSLLVAVLAGFSETNSQRVMAARAAPKAAELARELDIETRRLAASVRTLTADRDRLAARVDTLERNLEDLTGSIKRQAAIPAAPAASPPTPPAQSVPVGAAPAVPAAPAMSAVPKEAAVAPEAARSTPVRPPTPAVKPQLAAVEEPASAAPAADDTGVDPAENRAQFGLDLGGATSFERLRAIWSITHSRHAALLEGLHPVVAARENGPSKTVELRLIVGPLASRKAAARLCAALKAARQHCRLVDFEGKRLAQADEAPERQSAGGHRSAPAPTPKPPWPFR